MDTEQLFTLVCSRVCQALDWGTMKHLQSLLAKATNCLVHSRVAECKAQLSIWTLVLRDCDVLGEKERRFLARAQLSEVPTLINSRFLINTSTHHTSSPL